MYNHFQLGVKYLKHYLTAANGKGHGTHSPFIFHFITQVLNDKQHYPEYDTVEKLRQELSNNQTILSVEDFGAGSAVSKSNQRTIASIAKNAAKSKKLAQLLFRMVRMYQPETILELGTSLGITTSYLSLAKPDANVITMEGATTISNIARINFDNLQLNNISIIDGNFDHILAKALEQLSTTNFAFVDGNHRQQPTENYFQQLLSRINDNSILIFDDIHWSQEMEAAWATIKNHPAVRCTVDLFFIGVVFFRPEFHEKQHFTIRF